MRFTLPKLIAAALSVSVLTMAQAQPQAPIKIGFMAELSGPQGVLGQDQYGLCRVAG